MQHLENYQMTITLLKADVTITSSQGGTVDV